MISVIGLPDQAVKEAGSIIVKNNEQIAFIGSLLVWLGSKMTKFG